jgi:predicted tellurium resistance membrane protein TerC
MTLDQLQDTVTTVLNIGTPGLLIFALIAMWRGWIVPKRETVDLKATIQLQASTIETLESANDRLLNEVATPLAQVLAALPTKRPR